MSDRSVPLRVGDMLYGYCGGAFGRDDYDDKRVEAIGADWVVARHGEWGMDEGPDFFHGDPESLCRYREKPRAD